MACKFNVLKILKLATTLLLILVSCNHAKTTSVKLRAPRLYLKDVAYTNPNFKTIHVFVALCDNKYQGIVPVPAKIGNGQDPDNNLYWGGDYGVRTFFKKSKYWKLIKKQKLNDTLLERLIFKNNTNNYYLVADGYNGKYIKQTTVNFFNSCSGLMKDTLRVNGIELGIDGNAALVAYIGHDGLMDFQLQEPFINADGKTRDCIALACISKKYFGPILHNANATPLVYTTGLMCPEAYTLHDALNAYMAGKSTQEVRMAAAASYNKYQKSGLQFAQNLLVSGD